MPSMLARWQADARRVFGGMLTASRAMPGLVPMTPAGEATAARGVQVRIGQTSQRRRKTPSKSAQAVRLAPSKREKNPARNNPAGSHGWMRIIISGQ